MLVLKPWRARQRGNRARPSRRCFAHRNTARRNRKRVTRVHKSSRRTGRSGPWKTHDMPGNLIYYALVLIVCRPGGGAIRVRRRSQHRHEQRLIFFIWLAVVIVIVGVVFALIRRALARRRTRRTCPHKPACAARRSREVWCSSHRAASFVWLSRYKFRSFPVEKYARPDSSGSV